MGTFVPPDGEVVDFEVISLEWLRETLNQLSGGATCFSPKKVSSGAVWWVSEKHYPTPNPPYNERAKQWMDISEVIFGPAAYISPREAQRLEVSNDFSRNLFDGEPMVKLAGNVFPVRKAIFTIGGIRHAEENQWWVPKGVHDRAKEIVRKGVWDASSL